MAQLSVDVLDDYETLSAVGADIVMDLVATTPTASIVVAMGDTPMGLYRELGRRREAGTFDAAGVRVFQLDEYSGIGPEDRRSLFGWVLRSFVEPLGIPAGSVVGLPTDGDVVAACASYLQQVDDATVLLDREAGNGWEGPVGRGGEPRA